MDFTRLDQQLRLFPNPANEVVYLEVRGLKGAGTWTMHDLSGRTLRTGPFLGPSMMIDVGGLPQGAYILKVDSADFVGSAPLVVAH